MSVPAAAQNSQPQAAPKRQLTLLDTTSIIVGIIIGSSIYKSAGDIAATVPDVYWLVGVWVAGGILSLVGALCYTELANAYPTEGGDYIYLNRAFGRKLGFLFAWAQLWIVRPGSIGGLAYVFGDYASRLLRLGDGPWQSMAYAIGAILALTAVNILGVRQGKWTQNVLTLAKYLGLAAVVVAGFFVAASSGAIDGPTEPHKYEFNLGLAMIFIFYAYGGWNEMAYVGSEVRNPQKNILRSLVLGTVAVTALYVLLNLAFVSALGMEGMRPLAAVDAPPKVVAADVLNLALGDWGARTISLLICISALGAINGMIFTGARIYYAMGKEHRLYAWLGQWSAERGTPARSLAIQGLITLALVIGFGLTKEGFESSVKFTTPVFWVFFFLVGVSLFVLRYRQPQLARPYRVPLYPLVPIIFCASCLYMIYTSLAFAIAFRTYEALWSVGILAAGLVLSYIDPARKRRQG
jgi:basic amino acid/polyamine antiporter, APA family